MKSYNVQIKKTIKKTRLSYCTAKLKRWHSN